MLSKETFVKLLEQVKKLEEYQDKIDSVFSLNEWPISTIACSIAEIIAEECGDKQDGYFAPLTIDFLYEYDYGKNYTRCGRENYLIQDTETKEEFRPKTFEELYDVIQYWNNKGEKND